MAEPRQQPRIPPQSVPLIDPATNRMTDAWYTYLAGEKGGSNNVNSGLNQTRQLAVTANNLATAAQGTADGAVAGVASLGQQTLTFSASFSPSSAFGSSVAPSRPITNSVTVTPAGGTGPYTYAWSITGSGITVRSPSAATTDFRATSNLADGDYLVETATCTVTDSLLATATCNVGVSVYGEPRSGGIIP